MAHALEYEFQMGDYVNNATLKIRFDSVMNKVNEALDQEQSDPTNIFTQQGLQNTHECWAEGVELFFENPAELNIYYPELYEDIKILLNQDPLNNVKIFSEEEKGRLAV
jgi:Mlc titration factor MtfA (ptsG expression regulator)